MFKKVILAASIMLALGACAGDYEKTKHKRASTQSTEQSSQTSQSSSTNTNNATNNSQQTNTKTAGITIQVAEVNKIKQAELESEFGKNARGAAYTLKVGSKTYQSGDVLDVSDHMPKNTVTDVAISHTGTKNVDGKNYYITEHQKIRGYRQDYSVIAGYQRTGIASNIEGQYTGAVDDEMEVIFAKGQVTAENALPKTGTYNYSGAAFANNDTDGKLSYDVNFDKRIGSGKITGIESAGDITLHEGSIQAISHTNEEVDNSTIRGMGIESSATSARGQSGTYTLGFFGPNAEEIVGVVNSNAGEVGFGGKRSATPTK